MILDKNIKKGIRLIFVDFLGLTVGILNGFFLPLVFSIEGYALFRTFTLYAAYAVVFSFGLSDGIYLMYGGKEEKTIDTAKTKAYYFFLIKLQLIIFIFLFILSYIILKDKAFLFFSFFVMPLQLIHFFRLYYRALGEFDKYSLLQVALIIFEFFNTILIVFFIKSSQPDLFITIKIVNHVLVAVILTIIFCSKFKNIKTEKFKWFNYLEIMKPGLLVLIADMFAVMLFSLDRWFIMFNFNKVNFAYYSFAVSILNLFIVFIASITNIFYSYISKNNEDSYYIKNLKNYVLMISSFFPLGYFVLEFIIKTYLSKYNTALSVLWILIITLPFISVVNVIYINKYKASKSIKLYMKRMIIILMFSFLLNIIAVNFFGTISAVAWATFLSFVFWYFYSSRDIQEIYVGRKEIIYLLILNISFICIKMINVNLFLSFIIYMLIIFILVFIFYNREFVKLFFVYRND